MSLSTCIAVSPHTAAWRYLGPTFCFFLPRGKKKYSSTENSILVQEENYPKKKKSLKHLKMDLQGIEPQGGHQHLAYFTQSKELTGPLLKSIFTPFHDDVNGSYLPIRKADCIC
jgi:hypothetical protein